MTAPPLSRLDIARKGAVELPKIELNQLCVLRVDRVEDSDDRSRMRVASRWPKDNPSASIAGRHRPFSRKNVIVAVPAGTALAFSFSWSRSRFKMRHGPD